ncbi:glycoside hydrolase family 131 protein [Tulasnella calospora MUT 4182]|uniref:Glycoside hydrolase family 131 protein n=1 Tax=Tulasnella calospora MUT 4182 TaxID=1051891 RepID=A0A0C3L5T3_9AGAM|nr:glycoside hydrolase family 131 protein [Tulasnella calospora MUT 4182]
MKAAVAFVASLFAAASAGTVVGEYQYYIHGSGAVTEYLDVSTAYAHPGVSGESKGLKLSIDQTSTWNSAFWRTELIPQTSNNLGTGQKYYHFSVKRSSTNPPLFSYEHQVVFFESHFTELKVGISPNQTQLQWCVSSSPKYAVDFAPDVWYNFAYDIDFTGSTVGLWASTGSNPLQRVYAQTSASTSTNSADWHLGVLAFDAGTATEDWYFAGVYVESDTLTTSLRSGGLSGSTGTTSTTTTTTTTTTSPTTTKSSTTTSSTTTSKSSTTTTTTSTTTTKSSTTTTPTTTTTTTKSSTTTTPTTTTTTTSASGATQTHWGQCGGIGYR